MESKTLQAFEGAIKSNLYSNDVDPEGAAEACYDIHKEELDNELLNFILWTGDDKETAKQLLNDYQQSKDK